MIALHARSLSSVLGILLRGIGCNTESVVYSSCAEFNMVLALYSQLHHVLASISPEELSPQEGGEGWEKKQGS